MSNKAPTLLKLARAAGSEPRNPGDAPGKPGRFRSLPENPEDFRATLVEHLDELRTRLIRSVLVILVGWAVGWVIEPKLYEILNRVVTRNIESALNGKATIIWAFTNTLDPFTLKIKLSFLVGAILAVPFVVLQLWGFIKPGLKPSERKPIERIAPLSVVLFAMGVGFCCVILGPALRWFATFLIEFPNTQLIQNPATIIAFCMKMMLAFGVGFQLPLIVWVLGALNLLSAATLIKYWRHSSVVIFFAAAILTPSNDAFSMLMMAIPMVLLFMISVFAVRTTQRKRTLAVIEGDSAPDGVEEESD